MAKNLVIVESPAKAKTIEGFLGKDFLVRSCFGHIRDLSKKNLSIDVEKGFIPNYEVPADKKKIIAELKKESDTSDFVWLASDEDREGEAISWHLSEVLKLDEKKSKRIVFHEITKTAIIEAIEKPRTINKNLVDAQQARRVLDRLVGYELSPVLWKKVKPALSAGRVQSVAVRLIVERENEIKSFSTSSFYKVSANFIINKGKEKYYLKAELSVKFKTKDEALSFLEKCKKAEFSITDIETKPAKKSPAPPFTTSTLQQEASRKLGFSVAKTMLVAQQLYEAGKITYMRTDSVNLSDMALGMAKNEITTLYGEKYVKIRNYVTKSKGAQEAHEAIRPTYLNSPSIKGTNDQKKLYELIWKRTVASQMSDAQIEKTNVTINGTGLKDKFVAVGEVLKFDGFLKVYLESTDDEDDDVKDGVLPPVKIGDSLLHEEITATERFTQQPPRYTEASLVKKLEELGIGRPSTYAPTISTIQKREYVVNETREGTKRLYDYIILKNNDIKEEQKSENTGFEKSKLFPTDIGTLVNNFLMQYFINILDYNFTARVEKEFDEVAQGKKQWNLMIKDFYKPFHDQVIKTLEESKKVSGEKLLGKDPVTGKNVFVKIGRFGPMVQIGESDTVDKPKFTSLMKNQSIDTISLDEALALFALPRVVGRQNEDEIIASVGRFGPYVKYKNAFYSLKKTDDPLTVTLERALEVIEEKDLKDKNKVINDFKENNIKVLNGRFGPYISSENQNYKIPKGNIASELSLDDCLEIIKNSDKPKVDTKVKSGKKKK
jgi:DNA topoisomerase-1